MEPCSHCSGFGSPIGRVGRLVWLVCGTCRIEFATDQRDGQEEVH